MLVAYNSKLNTAGLDEKYGQAPVLAEAEFFLPGDRRVLPDFAEDLPAGLRLLGGGHRLEASGDVGGQDEIGLLNQPLDPFPYLVKTNTLHALSVGSPRKKGASSL